MYMSRCRRTFPNDEVFASLVRAARRGEISETEFVDWSGILYRLPNGAADRSADYARSVWASFRLDR